ncbi:hypothetical protein ACKKBG_A18355 [Auxenochlorella protothecoides x Auxenochlorella symbiontica]
MSTATLPSPRTGTFLEVSFRRLLGECEAVVQGSDRSQPEFAHWPVSPLFHHYIATLEEQLVELQKVSGSRLEPEVLRAYRGAVAALRASLQEPAVPATFQGPDPFISEDTQPAEQADPAAPPSPRTGLGLRRRDGPGPDANDDRGLDSQAQLQDALTDELAVLAASLKSNTLAMEGRVRERGSLLDATETALDRSLVGVKASNLAATAIHRKRRMGFCLTLLALLGIVSAFVGMYLFIKLTSLAGYRAVKVVHVTHARGQDRWAPQHLEL